jgi:hypothetical protein
VANASPATPDAATACTSAIGASRSAAPYAEKAMLALERRELTESPKSELDELALIHESKGPEPAWPGRSPSS